MDGRISMLTTRKDVSTVSTITVATTTAQEIETLLLLLWLDLSLDPQMPLYVILPLGWKSYCEMQLPQLPQVLPTP